MLALDPARIVLMRRHTSGEPSAHNVKSAEPRFTPAVETGTSHSVKRANDLARING
jgi:hypothetical protein